MHLLRFSAVLLLMIGGRGLAFANCETMFAASGMGSKVVVGKDDFARSLQNACNVNGARSSAGSSVSIAGWAIGGSGSSSNVSFNKFCDGSDKTAALDETYQEYIASTAPAAYEAYSQCVKQTDFDFSLIRLEPKDFTLLMSFRASSSADSETAKVAYDAPRDAKCQWEDVDGHSFSSRAQDVKAGSKLKLSCTRDDQRATSITVYRSDIPDNAQMIIPWPRFNAEATAMDHR
jgi:hypothetical protein